MVFQVRHTNESADCQVPGLQCVLVVVTAAVGCEVVQESQAVNLAWVNLAMGHEVLQSAESSEVAYSVVLNHNGTIL